MPRSSSAVSPTAISSIADSLTTLPEKTKEGYTLREAVAALADPIHTALERGYSHADIAVILHDHGIPISPASLKSYLPQKGQPKRRTRRPRKTETLPIIEAASTPEPTPAPAEEPAETAPTEEAAPKKRRGRQPGTKTAAAKTATKAAAPKTAAKSKSAPRTTASKGRGRKKQSENGV